MASTYSKRLAKLEERMASRLNQPLATLWLDEGVSREEACIMAGYDVSLVDRIRFVRWMTPAETAVAPPEFSWDQLHEYGPPKEHGTQSIPTPDPQQPEAPVRPDPVLQEQLDPFAEDPDRRAARRLETAKLREATRRYAKTLA